ncbi:DUF4249 domain-containing protein [Chryseolinea lacunae]|uniref:DUF4249 domain-containing protein n=1 Tax=Chryseolinea lacunae TaxID=2801331 RepID=A0ABS1KS32_9BACT|nr:DUF4249 domain-containing protein [Chryseolinea lacunae]MBL0742067.1 DUF4249 domain-containing protein [Chryseolinea lacunae]
MNNLAQIRFSLFILILSATTMLWGCMPEPLAVEGLPSLKPQIIVSSQIIPDQSLVVLLTKSFGALDAGEDSDAQALLDQIAVTDASVTITGPQGTYTLQALALGIYGGVSIPFQEGESYELRAKSETLGEVTAVTTVRRQVSFEDISADLVFDGYDDTVAQVTYSFNDPAEKNWYVVNSQRIRLNDLENNLLDPNAFTKVIDDVDFNGGGHAETFRGFRQNFHTGDTLLVSLSNVSEDYYSFIRLRLDNRYSFSQFLSEPVNYPSNVTGGKGFFNLYVPDIRLFVLK